MPATALTLLLISKLDLSGSIASGTIASVLGVLLLASLSLFFRRQFLGDGLLGRCALGVTALLLLYPRLPVAIIVESDIAHAVPLTLVAGLGHWFIGSVDWPLLTSLLTGSVLGIIVGGYLSAHAPDSVLRPILATTLMAVGGRLVL